MSDDDRVPGYPVNQTPSYPLAQVDQIDPRPIPAVLPAEPTARQR